MHPFSLQVHKVVISSQEVVEETLVPVLTGEPQQCEELLLLLESEEIAEAVPIPFFEEALGDKVHGSEVFVQKSWKKLQRRPRGKTLRCKPGKRCWRNFLLLRQ